MSKKKYSLLWSISKEDSSSSYLFGTMHVMDQRAFRYKELVEEKILECEVYAAEMNLDEANQAAMAETMDLDADVSLKTLLKPKVYKRLQKLFEKQVGMPLELFEKSQPIMVSNILTESQLSRDMPLSLDASLWHFAKAAEKTTVGIESFEEQLQVLASIPLDYQLKGLKDLVRNFKKTRKQLFKLTRIYERGDIQSLWKQTKKQAGGIRKLMIYDRNKIMAKRIANIAREQTVFAAVGAGHLSGGKGIIRLLKKEGFRLRPIFLPDANPC